MGRGTANPIEIVVGIIVVVSIAGAAGSLKYGWDVTAVTNLVATLGPPALVIATIAAIAISAVK